MPPAKKRANTWRANFSAVKLLNRKSLYINFLMCTSLLTIFLFNILKVLVLRKILIYNTWCYWSRSDPLLILQRINLTAEKWARHIFLLSFWLAAKLTHFVLIQFSLNIKCTSLWAQERERERGGGWERERERDKRRVKVKEE